MDFSIKAFDTKTGIASAKAGCIAVGVFEGKQLSAAAKALDGAAALSAAVKSGDISGKAGSTLLLRNVNGVGAERVLLVGLGKEAPVSQKDFAAAMHAVAKTFASLGAVDAIVALPFDDVKGADVAWTINCAVQAARNHAYRFDDLKSKKDAKPDGVKKIVFALATADGETGKATIAASMALQGNAHPVRSTMFVCICCSVLVHPCTPYMPSIGSVWPQGLLSVSIVL